MSEVKVDTISERTAANGVAVDGVTIKDSGLTIPSGGTLTVASGATIDASAGTATGFGGDNTPAWQVYLSSSQDPADDTFVKLTCDSSVYDTDSGYDGTTNYRYTIPTGEGGKYFIYAQIAMHSTSGTGNVMVQGYLQIRKNGTTVIENQFYANNYGKTYAPNLSMALDLSAGDYLECWGLQNTNDSSEVWADGLTPIQSGWGGFKMIGV
jgi:hypothetical protein